MIMKRIFACILILCLLVSLAASVYAADGAVVQAGGEEAMLLQAKINFGGYLHSATVLQAKDGTILVPLEWMTYYGGLKSTEFKGVIQYYKPDQAELRNYAKRWLILPQTGDYWVNWYFDNHMFSMFLLNADDFSWKDSMQLISALTDEARQPILDRYFSQKNTQVQRIGTNYMPIHKGRFSKVLPYEDDYWVPLSELLSLLEISAGVSSDGRILCMKPSQITIFDVLYEHEEEIEDLLFDSEDVVGNDFMAGTGWFVATLTGELHNVVPSLGREIDYKEIFTSYLQDNEVYLSTFNATNDSKASYYKKVADNFKDIKTIFSISAKGHKPIYDMFLESVTNPEFYMRYFEPAKKAGTVIDVAANVMTYIEAFANQVEDHRLMLNAVYKYDADTTWPSYVASQAISKMYESESDLAVRGTVDLTRKVVFDGLSEELYKKAYGGWYYAIEITKVFCKDDYEYVVNSSKINLVSNTVQYSYDIAEERFYHQEFSKTGMNNIRLCMMMSLIGSRHAYNTYYTGDIMKEDIDSINEILSKLYLAGTNRTENTKNICKDRLAQYQDEIPNLILTKNDPVVLAETDMLLHAIGNGNWDKAEYMVVDTDQDLYEEIEILFSTGAGFREAKVDINNDKVSVGTGSPLDIFKYGAAEITPEEHMVFGDSSKYLAALDSHFSKRSNVLCAMTYDLNEDGTSDRIYAIYNAPQHWDRDSNKPLNFPDGNLSLIAAEAQEDGVMLRFYFDPSFKGNGTGDTDIECSFENGELIINGYAYAYQKDIGTAFKKIGLVRLQSIYSYLSGEIKPWEQSRVDVSYPDDSNRNKMNLQIDGVNFFVHAEKDGKEVLIHEIQVEPQGKTVPIIGRVTTDNTAKEIIQALSLVSWDDHQAISPENNLNAVMGPYPLRSNDISEETYECSVLWALPNGEIYQLVMKLHEETLDTSPYSLSISSLKKPKVSVCELLLKTPEQVAEMLSGYTDWLHSSGDTIYGNGSIGDATVEVVFKPLDGKFVAQDVEVRFNNDTITIFPGLNSTAAPKDAQQFLQKKMDWDWSDSKTEGDIHLYYESNFYYDENTQGIWYLTTISEYTWSAEEGYSDSILGGFRLSYTGHKDDSSLYWYWVLYA